MVVNEPLNVKVDVLDHTDHPEAEYAFNKFIARPGRAFALKELDMKCTKPVLLSGPTVDRRKYPKGQYVPCGKCRACRKTKINEWSGRLLHELSYYNNSCFATFTYSDDFIPDSNSLRKQDFISYFKRLRKTTEKNFKYFACGEYGKKTKRPHYHALIFGLSPNDDDHVLEKCWKKGFSTFGTITPRSINYVCKYISKSLSGQAAYEEYDLTGREPIFRLISKGLGRQWCIDNAQDLITNKCYTIGGKKNTIPRYYLKVLDYTSDMLDLDNDNEIKIVKHYTGLSITVRELFDGPYYSEQIKWRDGIVRAREQRERTLKAKTEMFNKDKI